MSAVLDVAASNADVFLNSIERDGVLYSTSRMIVGVHGSAGVIFSNSNMTCDGIVGTSVSASNVDAFRLQGSIATFSNIEATSGNISSLNASNTNFATMESINGSIANLTSSNIVTTRANIYELTSSNIATGAIWSSNASFCNLTSSTSFVDILVVNSNIRWPGLSNLTSPKGAFQDLTVASNLSTNVAKVNCLVIG